jgi:hypothetical protein
MVRAKYNDVFGNSHMVEYCIKNSIVSRDGKRPILQGGPPCAKHNCADQQCETERE